jgi:hypothetical protein
MIRSQGRWSCARDNVHEPVDMKAEMSANNAIQLTTDPRHASCVRTCRATGPLQLIADVRPEADGYICH